jgi:acyl-CoA synthetase (AMP-forming)/AMP-acid ligase II
VVNRLVWMQAQFGIGADDVVLQKTPFGFDVSVWEFFWPLQQGACLVMARPDGHRDPAYLRDVVEREGVTTLHFVPSMLQPFVEAARRAAAAALRHVVCSGEALPPALVRRFYDRFAGPVVLTNLYGPTEAAVDVSCWTCPRDGRGRRGADRPAGVEHRALRAGHWAAAGARGHPRRAVHRRGAGGARLPGPRGDDRGALRPRSVLGAGRRAAVPDGRPGAPAGGRRHRVPGAARLPGEGARLPHRAGRDRGRAAGHESVTDCVVVARADVRASSGWWRTWWATRRRRRCASTCGGACRSTWCRPRSSSWTRSR